MVSVKNDFLTVLINEVGAEIFSVKDNSGKEFMWDGNPNVWNGHAPVLFPIVGGLKDDEYVFEKNIYHLSKHGFAKESLFEVLSLSTDSVTFVLKPNSITKKMYPFDYEFKVSFVLEKDALKIEYRVENLNDGDMYFSLGAHEAYACKGGIENYYIKFEKNETLSSRLVEGSLLSGKEIPVISNTDILNLKNSYFENDALIFKNPASKSLEIIKKGDINGIKVDFADFNYLLIWTIPQAEYICIEPWNGMPDSVKSNKDFTQKEGIIKLSKGKSYSCFHTIYFK